MAVPMDNSLDQSSTERVQRLFNKNVELENKRRKAAQARIPSDPNTWQQMRENYESIILENHAFSEQHEIEYALWQLHYRRIEELRAHFNAALASTGSAAAQSGKGPARGGPDRIIKIRAQFKTFLSESTGFYHDLMLKIRAKYGLPLGHFSDDPESQNSFSKDGAKSAEVKKGLISCHRCLIYLGDLARYKGLYGEGDSKTRDFAAASSYYMQACSLWPSSGNPHHQLAILASYSGSELVAIYRYFRSLGVDTPFTTARDNLIIAFEKNRQSYSQLLGEAKASTAKAASSRVAGKGRGKGETRVPPKDNRGEVNGVQERASTVPEIFKAFSTRFVRLNGILFTRTSLETFEEVLSMVRNDLLELLSSGPDEAYTFGSDAIESGLAVVRMIAILIFTVHNVNKETENQSYAEILQRSVLLQNAFTAIFDFMGHILERCVQLSDPSASYMLPGIMVFVEWLACHQDIAVGSEVEEKQANARLFFWNNCIDFLNKLLAVGSMFLDKDEDETCFFNMTRYDEGETANRLALPEDFELRGFLPLVPAQLILDFSRKHSFGSDDGNKEKKSRIQRIVAAGKALANVVRVGDEGIYFDVKLKKFIIGSEPPMSDDYSLINTLEVPDLSSNPVTSQMSLGMLQPKPELYTEGEEEDEVIVFKPSMTEKHVDGQALNLTSSDILTSGINAAEVDVGNEIGSLSAGLDAFLMQNGLITKSRPPTNVGNNNAQYHQPIHTSTSKWLLEQAPTVNGLAGLSLLDNGPTMKSDPHYHHLEALQPVSVPFPQSVNLGPGCDYPFQVPETVVPSKFDSVMSSGVASDNLSLRQSVLTSAGSKKNPVSRPLRHQGPPPGFATVPSKSMGESLPGLTLKNEVSSVRPMDDYRWFDGYQLPSSNLSNGLHSSLYSSGQSHLPVSKSNNSSMGMLGFPFPGKQMSTMQVQMENPKIWQDYQFSEQVKLQQEQQQQLQRGNQQSVALPQQYQGHSLWEGRFIV